MSQAEKKPLGRKREALFWGFVGSFTVLLGLLLHGLSRAASHQPDIAGFGVIAAICCAVAVITGIGLIVTPPKEELVTIELRVPEAASAPATAQTQTPTPGTIISDESVVTAVPPETVSVASVPPAPGTEKPAAATASTATKD